MTRLKSLLNHHSPARTREYRCDRVAANRGEHPVPLEQALLVLVGDKNVIADQLKTLQLPPAVVIPRLPNDRLAPGILDQETERELPVQEARLTEWHWTVSFEAVKSASQITLVRCAAFEAN